jgi:predicted GIY-YIG superfamily endonuclease
MVVYLLHFDRPYRHAKHYLGSCQDLERRLTQHGKGRGARLLEVVQAVGIGWQLARTWCGGKKRERQLKNQGGASRRCPICKEARRVTHH